VTIGPGGPAPGPPQRPHPPPRGAHDAEDAAATARVLALLEARAAVIGRAMTRACIQGVPGWAWVMAQAALIRPIWLNACGKLPIISPLGTSTSSASRPTSLIAATARSKVAVAWSTSPASACAWASQKVHSRKVPSSPARPSRAR
jgi:hypothetical protein